jgi:hypothetical protein
METCICVNLIIARRFISFHAPGDNILHILDI